MTGRLLIFLSYWFVSSSSFEGARVESFTALFTIMPSPPKPRPDRFLRRVGNRCFSYCLSQFLSPLIPFMSTAGARVVRRKHWPISLIDGNRCFSPVSPLLPRQSLASGDHCLPFVGGGTNVCAIILCCQAKNGVRFVGSH